MVLGAWLLVAAFVPVYIHFDHAGWDLQAYRDAAAVVRRGGDPYATGIQREVEFLKLKDQTGQRPLLYLYPPATLPLLCLIEDARWIYWVIYGAGVITILWVGLQFAEPGERAIAVIAGAAAIYFPGLLELDCVLGGNLSFVFYGVMLAAAIPGWRSNRWRWFYAAVLLASTVKPPWLALLGIPFFSAKRQAMQIAFVGSTWVSIFVAQAWLLPVEFSSWREALRLEFVYNGFGLSPSGVFAQWQSQRGFHDLAGSVAVYVVVVTVVLSCLWRVSSAFHAGRISLARFGPVLLIGVLLLEPRLKDYDASVLTVSMGLVLWRISRRMWVGIRAASWLGVVALANAIAASTWPSPVWNRCACLLVVGCFGLGCRECLSGGGGGSLLDTAGTSGFEPVQTLAEGLDL